MHNQMPEEYLGVIQGVENCFVVIQEDVVILGIINEILPPMVEDIS
jgi:hypothetical protein